VFFAVGTIGTVPGLRDALLLLADYGLDVDLFVRGDEPFTHPKFGDKRVHVTSDKLGILSRSPTHPRRMRRGNGPYLWVVGHVYHLLWPSLVFLVSRAQGTETPCIAASSCCMSPTDVTGFQDVSFDGSHTLA